MVHTPTTCQTQEHWTGDRRLPCKLFWSSSQMAEIEPQRLSLYRRGDPPHDLLAPFSVEYSRQGGSRRGFQCLASAEWSTPYYTMRVVACDYVNTNKISFNITHSPYIRDLFTCIPIQNPYFYLFWISLIIYRRQQYGVRCMHCVRCMQAFRQICLNFSVPKWTGCSGGSKTHSHLWQNDS